MLEGKYDAAVEALRRALELEPHSPALLTDLATAYFQRAQQEDRKDDLGAAYEYLSQALKLHPDDPVALFNRAIVAEHQFLYHQALDDWDHYLRVDPRFAVGGRSPQPCQRVCARNLKEHEQSGRAAAVAGAGSGPRQQRSPTRSVPPSTSASKNICTRQYAPGCLRPIPKTAIASSIRTPRRRFFFGGPDRPAAQ